MAVTVEGLTDVINSHIQQVQQRGERGREYLIPGSISALRMSVRAARLRGIELDQDTLIRAGAYLDRYEEAS